MKCPLQNASCNGFVYTEKMTMGDNLVQIRSNICTHTETFCIKFSCPQGASEDLANTGWHGPA